MRQEQQPHPPRVLYCGTAGPFSLLPLWQLLAAGLNVAAILVPGRKGEPGAAPIEEVVANDPALGRSRTSDLELPILNRDPAQSIVQVGWESGIPVFRASRLDHPETVQLVGELAPDIACVACFPYRLPTALLEVPPAGFLNLHPSLLPAYRGPNPLFWILRNGEHRSGVTVHLMDEALDTGDILLQEAFELPDGISGIEVEQLCAKLGGKLLLRAVLGWPAGRLQPQPQAGGGHYQPWPSVHDFTIYCDWPARRAFNFMRGTAHWQRPYTVSVASETIRLRTALAYTAAGELGALYRVDGRQVRIQFKPGILTAVLT
jgi:methionyl-tRNA formyltransferase